MVREPIDSTVISSIGYDPLKRELEIEFRESGDIYLYFEIPQHEYDAFTSADSKGEYLNLEFKPKEYRHKVIKQGAKRETR